MIDFQSKELKLFQCCPEFWAIFVVVVVVVEVFCLFPLYWKISISFFKCLYHYEFMGLNIFNVFQFIEVNLIDTQIAPILAM